MSLITHRRFATAVTVAASLAVAACGGREAESETPVSEAEVETDLPETVISDQQLEATANAAADIAATPPAAVVAVPTQTDAAGAGNMQQPATGNEVQPQAQ